MANDACFQGLSREIRDMIYKYVLVVKTEIIPYPTVYEKENTLYQNDRARYPSPALLRVSKMIGAEARSILYSKNQWRLPLDMNISVSMFTQHPNLFRSIVVAFDQRDVSPTIKAQISKREHSSTDYEGVAKIAAARARKVHKRLLEAQERVCIHAWRLLSVMGQLRSLLVELEDFACPSGCCREKLMTRAGVLDCWFLYHLKAKQMNKRQKRGMIVPQISVRGLLSQSERNILCKEYGFAEA